MRYFVKDRTGIIGSHLGTARIDTRDDPLVTDAPSTDRMDNVALLKKASRCSPHHRLTTDSGPSTLVAPIIGDVVASGRAGVAC